MAPGAFPEAVTTGTGLGMDAIRICPVNGVSPHTMLSEIELVWMKSVPWPLRLMLTKLITPEYHSSRTCQSQV